MSKLLMTLFALGTFCVASTAQVSASRLQEPAICALMLNPNKFLGREIRVTAVVSAGMEGMEISDGSAASIGITVRTKEHPKKKAVRYLWQNIFEKEEAGTVLLTTLDGILKPVQGNAKFEFWVLNVEQILPIYLNPSIESISLCQKRGIIGNHNLQNKEK